MNGELPSEPARRHGRVRGHAAARSLLVVAAALSVVAALLSPAPAAQASAAAPVAGAAPASVRPAPSITPAASTAAASDSMSPVPAAHVAAARGPAASAALAAAPGVVALAQPGGFGDVAGDAYYSEPVAALAALGVFAGTECDAGFCPDEAIDRKTMAVWTVRVLDGSDPTLGTESRFDDVNRILPIWWVPFIERMAELGVTQGCGDGTNFCPNDSVTRAQMAVFLSRAYNLAAGPDPGFSDVSSDAWYAADVARLAASGITQGCGDGTAFCPRRHTTRAQMATFLWRAENRGEPEPASVVLGDLPNTTTVAASARQIQVSWPEAAPVAGSPVAGYEVQWRSGDEDWDAERRRVVIGLNYVIGGLDDGTSYVVRVRPAAVETASVSGASITAGEGSTPTAEIVEDAPPLREPAQQSVSALPGPVNFEMEGEPVWPATIAIPVDMTRIADASSVQLAYYNEGLQSWVPVPGSVLDRERGVLSAEVYHLTDYWALCTRSSFAAPVVGTVCSAVAVAGAVAEFVDSWWDSNKGWLREGWHNARQYVLSDVPMLAGAVLDKLKETGTTVARWVRVGLEAAAYTESEKLKFVKGILHDVFNVVKAPAPRCSGSRPPWVVQTTTSDPGNDAMLWCDETAVTPDAGDSDLGLKLAVNRNYSMTLTPRSSQVSIGERSPDRISVEDTEFPTDLADLIAGGLSDYITDGKTVFLPAGGTTTLRVPLGAFGEESLVRLTYMPDLLSTHLQALLYGLSVLTGGGTGIASKKAEDILLIAKCAWGTFSETANMSAVDLLAELKSVVSQCIVPRIPNLSGSSLDAAFFTVLGGLGILNEYGNMIGDDPLLGGKDVIIETPKRAAPGRLTSVSAGTFHSCGIKIEDTVTCWGGNSWGQADAPTGRFSVVSAGGAHTCGIRTDRTAACWGADTVGQSDAPTGAFAAVSTGASHTCGLRIDGNVVCWGHNDKGQTDAPSGRFSAVSAGGEHSCAIKTDGEVVCWGHNNNRQTNAPSGTFRSISAGWDHSCALKTNNTLACWGNNDRFQATNYKEGAFTAVTAGAGHTCAIRMAGHAECWGHNEHGQTDTPDGTLTAVSAGAGHACGIRAGDAVCWGNNETGQTDAPQGAREFTALSAGKQYSCGITTDRSIICWSARDDGSPTAPAGQFSAVSAGGTHRCAIKTDRTLECWDGSGQADAPTDTFTAIDAGDRHTCGLRTSNTITCWGNNDNGQIDAPHGQFSAVSAGWFHSCGLRADGTIECWGSNSYGKTAVPNGTYKAVTAGGQHSCGLKTDNTIACWGNNDEEQTATPGGQFSAVSAGWYHSCGLKTDNTIACWGSNVDGQADAPGGEFSAVTVGRNHSCGLRTDNTAECWGQDYAPTTTTDATLKQFSAVTAGELHSCGLKTDNTAECWGSNGSGLSDAPSGAFTAVTAGSNHTCGLRTDNTIECWGQDVHGEVDAPSGRFSAVEAGNFHSCGLRTNGTVTCWGNNFNGESLAPSGQFSAVTAGWEHSCGLRTDATIECWGSNSDGRADAPSGRFSAVTAGGRHSCGLRTDNTVTCWGNNSHGQTNTPKRQFSAVTAGSNHTCGLKTDNTITCWGNNNSGQTNVPGSQADDDTPPDDTTRASGTDSFKAVTGWYLHTCGLRTDDTITCWNRRWLRHWIDGSQLDAPSGRFKAITGWYAHTCGLRTDDTITCWQYGQSAFEEKLDAPSGRFKAVATGSFHSCGIRASGTIACWGRSVAGLLDAPSGTFAAVAVGSSHSCAIRTNNTIACWGRRAGLLDAPSGTFAAVAAGSSHFCAIRTDNTIACWGPNNAGQTDAPQGTYIAIAAGSQHSCAIRTDNTIACWGRNNVGQTDAPQGTFAALAAGSEYPCAIRTSGTIACWGRVVIVTTGGPGPTSLRPGEGVPCAPHTPTCRYLDIELFGFAPGTYTVSCSHDGWGDIGPSTFWTFTITVGESGSASSSGPCFLNFAQLTAEGAYVTVSRTGIQTVRSNWLK